MINWRGNMFYGLSGNSFGRHNSFHSKLADFSSTSPLVSSMPDGQEYQDKTVES